MKIYKRKYVVTEHIEQKVKANTIEEARHFFNMFNCDELNTQKRYEYGEIKEEDWNERPIRRKMEKSHEGWNDI